MQHRGTGLREGAAQLPPRWGRALRRRGVVQRRLAADHALPVALRELFVEQSRGKLARIGEPASRVARVP